MSRVLTRHEPIEERLHVELALSAIALLAAGIASMANIQPSFVLWPLILLSVCSAAALVARSSPLGWGSVGALLLVTTGLFHLGLVPALWLGLRDSYGFVNYTINWLHPESARQAAAFVVQALAAFAIGYWLALMVRRHMHLARGLSSSTRHLLLPLSPSPISLDALAGWGLLLSLLGAALVLWNFRLLGSYQRFLTESNFEAGAWGPFLLIAGWSIAVAARRRLISMATGAACLFVLGLMAMSGARTFLFMAAVVVTATWVKAHDVYTRVGALLVSPLVLTVASLVRARRDGNGESLDFRSPINALYEFGSSFRPLAELVRLEQLGVFNRDDEFVNSFFVWPVSKWETFTGGSVAEPYGHGVRVLSETFGKEYRFALSNLADLYVSFDRLTALVVMLLVGVGVFLLDWYRRGTSIGALATMAVAIPALYAVRQPVAMFIPQFTFTAGVTFTGVAISVAYARVLAIRDTRQERREKLFLDASREEIKGPVTDPEAAPAD